MTALSLLVSTAELTARCFHRYEELLQTLKKSVTKNAYSVPQLPKDLALRRRDVLNLYKEIDLRKTDDSKGMAPAGVSLPTFEEALRLYYPKDSKEKTGLLLKWVNDVKLRQTQTPTGVRALHSFTPRCCSQVLAARDASMDQRTRDADAALVQQLDTDGNGSISIAEFCALSKRTGLSKAQMRARFRERDWGNSGVLQFDQVREVLHELRQEQRLRSNKQETLDLEVFAGLRAAGDMLGHRGRTCLAVDMASSNRDLKAAARATRKIV